jgi:hypothetical protein
VHAACCPSVHFLYTSCLGTSCLVGLSFCRSHLFVCPLALACPRLFGLLPAWFMQGLVSVAMFVCTVFVFWCQRVLAFSCIFFGGWVYVRACICSFICVRVCLEVCVCMCVQRCLRVISIICCLYLSLRKRSHEHSGGSTLRFHEISEGSLWISGSGPKSTLPLAEIMASISTFRPPTMSHPATWQAYK